MKEEIKVTIIDKTGEKNDNSGWVWNEKPALIFEWTDKPDRESHQIVATGIDQVQP